MTSIRSSVLLTYIAAVLTAMLLVQLAHAPQPIIVTMPSQVYEGESPMTDSIEYEPQQGAIQVSNKQSVGERFGLKPYQVKNFRLAAKVGKANDRERLMMALMWRETRAGKFGPVGDMENGVGKRSYGLWQMKVATAKDVLKRYPELWGPHKKWKSDEEVIARLITDNQWAAEMALGNIRRLEAKRVPFKRIPLAWNEGYSGSLDLDHDDHAFTMDVLETVQSPMIRELSSI